jgi:hypothetical protein
MTARYAHVGQQHRLAAVQLLEKAYQVDAEAVALPPDVE